MGQQPLTARALHDELSAVLGWGYSLTRKTLERMVEKGLVSFASVGHKNHYQAPKLWTGIKKRKNVSLCEESKKPPLTEGFLSFCT